MGFTTEYDLLLQEERFNGSQIDNLQKSLNQLKNELQIARGKIERYRHLRAVSITKGN